MWWDGHGWPHMYGVWWFMPLFGLICMVLFLYFVSRILGGKGCCGSTFKSSNQQNEELEVLKEEIEKLNREVEKLKKPTDHN